MKPFNFTHVRAAEAVELSRLIGGRIKGYDNFALK